VTGTTANLSVLGADDGGASNLTYTWSLANLAPAGVNFSTNGTNAASSTVVTFTHAGTYVLQVTITDTGGLSVTSLVNVTVNQTLTSIAVTPAASSIGPNSTQQFSAIALDQFGLAMATQPSFTWSLASGGGSVNSSTGIYTSPASGSATVKAASGSISGTTTITTVNQPPLVATSAGAAASPTVVVTGSSSNLSVLAVDDGGASNLTYSWGSTGPAAVTYTGNANGTNAANNITANFTQAGNYNFTVTITDSGGLFTTNSVPVTVLPVFASQSGSTLTINLNNVAPIAIAASGGNVTVFEDGVQVSFSGVAAIAVNGSATNNVLNFNGPLATPFTFTGNATTNLNVNSGTLNFASAAAITLGTLNVAAGASAVLPTATGSESQLILTALSLASGSTLDLANNTMILNYGGTDPIGVIAGYIKSGYNLGGWNGTGIISSAAQTPTNGLLYALGYADGKDGVVSALSSGQIEVKYTLLGDANLDGLVNAADFTILAANFNQPVTGWDQGDFNYDGLVNAADFTDLAANFNQGISLPAAAVSAAVPAFASTASTQTTPTTPALESDDIVDAALGKHVAAKALKKHGGRR
jgi:hypothetical protein